MDHNKQKYSKTGIFFKLKHFFLLTLIKRKIKAIGHEYKNHTLSIFVKAITSHTLMYPVV